VIKKRENEIMFFAIKEIMHNKKKFSIVVILIVLITYMVFFLTSLAYGLASSYTNGLNKVQADYIVMDKDANDNIMMSMLNDDDIVITTGQEERLGLYPAVATKNGVAVDEEDKYREEIYVFGVNDLSFYLPGEYVDLSLQNNEIIIDQSLAKLGYIVGDQIRLSGYDTTWEIKGITTKATFQTAPIVYTNMSTWQNYRFYNQGIQPFYNAIFVKGDIQSMSDNLKAYTISDFAYTLPGYTAQVLTFSIMIGFLIVMAAFILGIFIYVITLQKVSMFGVMKAQGISSGYIAKSVLAQTFLLMLSGSIVGIILTLVSGFFLGGMVPFAVNILFYAVILLSFFVFSFLGGLFSVGAIVKVDPIKAIG